MSKPRRYAACRGERSWPESVEVLVDCSQMLPMNDLRATAGTQSSIQEEDKGVVYPTVWQASKEIWWPFG